MRLYWPIVLIVASNIFYNICSESTPAGLNPFATVTHIIGAVVSAFAFFILNPGKSLVQQLYAFKLVHLRVRIVCRWIGSCLYIHV